MSTESVIEKVEKELEAERKAFLKSESTLTEEEYKARLQKAAAFYRDESDDYEGSLYSIGSYSNGICYPYEVDSHGAPVDGSPEAPFDSSADAVRYVKEKLNSVIAEDVFPLIYSESRIRMVKGGRR